MASSCRYSQISLVPAVYVKVLSEIQKLARANFRSEHQRTACYVTDTRRPASGVYRSHVDTKSHEASPRAFVFAWVY